MRAALLIILTVLVAPNGIWSQEATPLEPSQRIRVTHRCWAGTDRVLRCSRWYSRSDVGIYRATRSDTLLFELSDGFMQVPIPLRAVRRIETVQGQRSKWLSGMGLGFFLGAISGTVIGYAATANDAWYPGLGAAAGLLVGAPVGMVAGGIVGASIHTERWGRIPLERFRLSFAPLLDRFALGLSADV